MSETKKTVKNQVNLKQLIMIPNLICIFRILCVPVYVTLSALARVNNDLTYIWWAFGMFMVAAISDILDGWVARRFNMTSDLGKVLDPFADKFMHVSVIMCLAFAQEYIHWAFVILIFLKELLMVLFALLFMKEGVKIQANMLGKIGSWGLSIGVILAFFTQLAEPGRAWPVSASNPIYITVAVVLSVAVLINYAAALNYLQQILPQYKAYKNGTLKVESDEDDAGAVSVEDDVASVETSTSADVADVPNEEGN